MRVAHPRGRVRFACGVIVLFAVLGACTDDPPTPPPAGIPLVSVFFPLDSLGLRVGDTVTVVAQASNGLPPRYFESDPGVLSVGPAGLIEALQPGVALVFTEPEQNPGNEPATYGEDTLHVTVTPVS